MDDHESSEQGAGESSDAARRQAALRALAQDQIQTQTPTQHSRQSQPPAPPQQRPTTSSGERSAASPGATGGFAALVSGKRPARGGRRRPVIATVVVALLVIVVAAAVGARVLLAKRTPPPPTVVRIDAINGGMSCGAQSAAWSPDSTLLAVEGMSGCGPSDGNQTTIIMLFDAASGKRVQTLQLDPLVYGDQKVTSAVDAARQALGYTGGSTTASDSLWYSSITWTPDGRSLLMTFSVSVPPPDSGVSMNVNGLLRLGTTTASQSRVWLDKLKYQQNGSVERWDLTTGTPALIPQPKLATAYSWKSDGTLAPANAGVSVGAPDGGQTFSIWQPGMITYFTFMSTPTSSSVIAPDQHRIQWGANMSPISPDGRYFYSYFPDQAMLTPPSVSAAVPHIPSVKPHDVALLAQAQRMTQTTPSQDTGGYVLAWRPDGRRMASVQWDLAIGPAASTASPNLTITIYDTSTGKVIGHVAPTLKKSDQSQPMNAGVMLSWSPDGKRLMMSEGYDNAITIWEPAALPA